MTPEERGVIMATLISAMKELGEIAECLIKGDPDDHWKAELGDLCGLGIQPLLDVAELEYYDACSIGWNRQRKKRKEAKGAKDGTL